jgi:hypothetical protein
VGTGLKKLLGEGDRTRREERGERERRGYKREERGRRGKAGRGGGRVEEGNLQRQICQQFQSLFE